MHNIMNEKRKNNLTLTLVIYYSHNIERVYRSYSFKTHVYVLYFLFVRYSLNIFSPNAKGKIKYA